MTRLAFQVHWVPQQKTEASFSCLYTYLLTSTTAVQCYLQYIHIMVVLLILYMIVSYHSILDLTVT